MKKRPEFSVYKKKKNLYFYPPFIKILLYSVSKTELSGWTDQKSKIYNTEMLSQTPLAYIL